MAVSEPTSTKSNYSLERLQILGGSSPFNEVSKEYADLLKQNKKFHRAC